MLPVKVDMLAVKAMRNMVIHVGDLLIIHAGECVGVLVNGEIVVPVAVDDNETVLSNAKKAVSLGKMFKKTSSSGLGPRGGFRRKMLTEISKAGKSGLTYSGLCIALGLSKSEERDNARKDLMPLIKLGFVRFEGSRGSGRYYRTDLKTYTKKQNEYGSSSANPSLFTNDPPDEAKEGANG